MSEEQPAFPDIMNDDEYMDQIDMSRRVRGAWGNLTSEQKALPKAEIFALGYEARAAEGVGLTAEERPVVLLALRLAFPLWNEALFHMGVDKDLVRALRAKLEREP